ncbi:DUF443 family protein [Staphylococcus caprae]|uniref:DUF443 family protein n=1 Tax=Staphylococcus caprae TaxID=29380 RepID=UPI001C830E24|nr:DUF443 family protein [Staphylococcus caprae]MBX5319884.1 DUF443 family protein [Staphylococcus caprae]
MVQGTIQSIGQSNRYKLIVYSGSFYILDIEKSIFTYFFPFINYLFPRYLREIDQMTAEKLMTKQRSKVKKSNYVFPIGLSIIISTILRTVVHQFDILVNSIFLLFSVIISIFSVLLLRLWLSYFNNKHIEIKYSNHKIKALLIPPRKFIFKSIGIFSYFSILYCLGMYAFIVSNKFNLLILIAGMILLFIITLTNYFLYPMEEENIEIHEIKSSVTKPLK